MFWDGDVIATHVMGDDGPIRVGPDANADVILPIATTIDGEGDTTLGAFIVSVSRTRADDEIRAPLHVGRSAWTFALSTVFHALLFVAVIVGSRIDVRAEDDAARLTAMQGYLARSSDRETKHDAIGQEHVPIAIAAEATTISTPPPVVVAPLTRSMSHTESGGSVSTPKGSVRVGDWVGTYTCLDRTYGLALHIDHAHNNDFHVVGSATSPDGIQASYRQRGVRNPATGVSSFFPEGWLGEPMPAHNLSGMHGRFAGDTFSGVIDDPQCGSVNLRRHA